MPWPRAWLTAALCWASCAGVPDGLRDQASPVGFVTISVGGDHSCAVTAEGRGYCWGVDDTAALGTSSLLENCQYQIVVAGGTPAPEEQGIYGYGVVCSRAPVELAGGLALSAVAANRSASSPTDFIPYDRQAFTCALGKGDGQAHCWGANSRGQLGLGVVNAWDPGQGRRPDDCCRPRPQPVKTDRRFTAIAAGGTHVCALGTDGATYCWGSNREGQLGQGAVSDGSSLPLEVRTPAALRALASGDTFSCGLDAAGAVWCWGTVKVVTPAPRAIKLPDGVVVTALSAAPDHACGLTAAGEAYCWSMAAMLGSEEIEPRLMNKAAEPWVEIAAVGWECEQCGVPGGVCGLVASGDAVCTGSLGNTNYQDQAGHHAVRVDFGDGHQLVPIAAGTRLAQLQAGSQLVCAIGTDGSVWCWGLGFFGLAADDGFQDPPPSWRGTSTTLPRRLPNPYRIQ